MEPSIQQKPAFVVHRFRQTFCLGLNAPMAKELYAIVCCHERRQVAAGLNVPAWMGEFIAALDEHDAGGHGEYIVSHSRKGLDHE